MDNNYHAVLDALTKASSQNIALLKDAESQLKCWETQPGFYSTLLAIVADRNLDVNIRWLSVLCAKNGVDCYWRTVIPVEEKIVIKQKLLSCINEPINQIALQLAVIASKIARYDFPKDWEELFPFLLSGMQSTDPLCQLRALLTMRHVIKSLASKRLTFDRRIYQQLTATIFPTIFHQWINLSKLFLEEAQRIDISKSSQLLESSLLSLKVLRKLIVYGFKDYSKSPDAVQFLSLIFQQIGPFLECRSVFRNRGNFQEMCEKYLVLLIKVLYDVLDIQPFGYVQFIRPTLECSVTFCFSKEFQDRVFERLVIQFLNLMKRIWLCLEYKPSKCKEDSETYSATVEAHKIKVEFFTLPVITEILQQLLSRYFLLSENDITNWENNPELFAAEEGVVSWKISLRPCTEGFFLSMFREFRDLLTPLVVEMVKRIQNNDANDRMSILEKEAVYNVAGLAAFDLYEEVDFDSWFTNILIPELRIKSNGYYIIRRRVIWLIGQWIPVKMSTDIRPLLYEVILQLLSNEENLLVRLATANTLKAAVDDYEFNNEQFLPYLESTIISLFMLLREVEECDLKMSVLHVLSFIIERMGCDVRPHVHSLMQYLPQLWDNCGDHNMLRCSIITCFVHLVQALRSFSETLHPSLIPMIAICTDISQPPHVYLLEDGLDLWWAILENTTVSSPELLNLASNLLPLVEHSGQSLRLCLQLIEANIMLGKENFLKRYGHDLVKTFLSAVTDFKSEGIIMILRVVETAFVMFPEDGPLLFQPLLSFVVDSILEALYKNQTKRNKQGLLDQSILGPQTMYLSLLSRVILHNQSVFVNLLQEKATKVQKDVNTILGELFDVWLDLMPLVDPIPKEKLSGLALTCLLTSGSEIVLDHICGIFLAVVEVMNDISAWEPGLERGSDLLVMKPENFIEEEGDVEREHNKRKQKLYKLDPVYTVNLQNYFRSQVMALKQSVGYAKFEDVMSTVDVETLEQVKNYMQN